MQRPTSVTVFGVLNLVFGVWGALGIAMAAVILFSGAFPVGAAGIPSSPFLDVWSRSMLLAGLVASGVLFAAGIGLLRMRPWARIASIGYAMYSVVTTVAGLTVNWLFVFRPMLAQLPERGSPETVGAMIGVIGSFVGGLLGMIFPVLLWYFMTRRQVVAAFAGIAPEQIAGGEFAAMPQPPARFDEAANPYMSPLADPTPLGNSSLPTPESVVETFVPTRNPQALAAYYLGLFSLFPCLGFPLGVAAVYCGIKGIRLAGAHPEVRGKYHAWAGVICGSLFGLFNFLLLLLAIVGGIGAAIAN
jgi:hypothetical protein